MINKLQPRSRFIEDGKRADSHQELMMSPMFKAALETAFAHYALGLPVSGLQSAAETSYKLAGAREFIEVLLNLGDTKKQMLERKTDELQPI